MAVHVDEIHTQVSAGASGHGASATDGAAPAGAAADRPWAREDFWRSAEAQVHRLRCRVAAEGFDD